ncbi:MAG: hypothetical protein WC804_03685, partial [Sphingomonas sp.]|uniref:hypothetical protein n=1 Tax=Sphingomonas sp. TaxID=28214 RepID=UPI0035623977
MLGSDRFHQKRTVGNPPIFPVPAPLRDTPRLKADRQVSRPKVTRRESPQLWSFFSYLTGCFKLLNQSEPDELIASLHAA